MYRYGTNYSSNVCGAFSPSLALLEQVLSYTNSASLSLGFSRYYLTLCRYWLSIELHVLMPGWLLEICMRRHTLPSFSLCHTYVIVLVRNLAMRFDWDSVCTLLGSWLIVWRWVLVHITLFSWCYAYVIFALIQPNRGEWGRQTPRHPPYFMLRVQWKDRHMLLHWPNGTVTLWVMDR